MEMDISRKMSSWSFGPCAVCEEEQASFKQVKMKDPHISQEIKYTLHFIECAHCGHNGGLFAKQEAALEAWRKAKEEEFKPCPSCGRPVAKTKEDLEQYKNKEK